ncbi:MAG: Gfo/Idh/MocA family oxidoreductase [Vicinamibacterales bacterium]
MKTRLGVVGVGHLGQHHARLLAGMDDVDLVGVVDTDSARAQQIATQYGTKVVDTAAALLTQVDAVVIASPTVTHVALSLPFVEAGVAVLVEKPIAESLSAVDRLLDAAAQRNTLVACGHTERFNPAVAAAAPFVVHPRFVEIHRLGTFPERSLDIDVIFDLMIHDLDLLLSLVGEEVVSIEAVGVNVLTPKLDIANVRLRFAGGCIANLTASRISRERVRKVRFFQPQAYVSVDFAAQEAEVYRLVVKDGRPTIEGGKLDVPREEPLLAELRDFVAAVRDGRPPRVSGQAGRAALDLATRVAQAVESQ